MSAAGTWPYYAGDGFVSVGVSYYGDDVELLLLVPDLGTYDAFRAGLDRALLDRVVAQRSPTLVQLNLPKFSVQADMPAGSVLQELGMQLPFAKGSAEFPKLNVANPYISDVLHQATVAIDESGTEASAATATAAEGINVVVSPPEPTVVVTVDRPFLFALRDNPTGALCTE